MSSWLGNSSPNDFDRQDILHFLTLSYLAIVLVPSAITALLLLLRIPTPWVPAQVGLAATLFGLYWVYLRASQQKWIVLGAFSGSVLLALLAAGFLYDVDWDGMTYHSEAVLGLLHGVNPIYSVFDGNFPLWTNHYPKAEWYFAAAMGGGFHRTELGKSYDFFLIYACGVYSWSFFRSLRLNRIGALLMAANTALNPIAATQILTFCVDGAMASLLSMLVLSSVAEIRRPTSFDRIIFVSVAAAAVATKFTGAVYVCITLVLVMAALLLFRSAIRPMLAMTAVLAAAVVLLGFNPYVTNVLQGNNPLYPVAGANKVSVISDWEAPREFLGRNRLQNFAVSFFSTSSETKGAESPTLKFPFTVRLSEIKASTYPDLRMGGWGVLFSGVFLSSLALYLYARGWQLIPEMSFAILLVLVTTFSNPYAWWARFVPQVALIPILLLAPCLVFPSATVNFMAKIIGVLLLSNSLLFLVLATENSARATLRANRSLELVYERCGPGRYWFDGNKTFTRYDVLPVYRGISISFKRPTATELASNRSIPFTMLKGSDESLHIDHCANQFR